MKNLFAGIRGARVRVRERLAAHTSFKIGGRADYFVTVSNVPALKKVLGIAREHGKRCMVIGAGTNMLFSDRGFRGVIIKLTGDFCRIESDGARFSCGAGALLQSLLDSAARKGYGGAETLAGIPGTIGGAVMGNAGAFGRWISGITERIAIIGAGIRERTLTNAQIRFGYRSTGMSRDAIIIRAEFKLTRKKSSLIRSEMKKYMRERRNKHPSGMCAGSYFKNPLPLAAGRLIDECGLKGKRVGDAMVSTKHGNFIMNMGNARASDVLKLARLIKRTMRAKKGVLLEEEVKVIR
jgi:UDP-N-acetylmuramate dehydrogenase